VLYVIGGGRIGGMETHLLHLLAGLDRTRFSPLVCCVSGSDDYQLKLGPAADRVENLRLDRFDTPRTMCSYIWALSKLFLSWKPHVVQTYGYGADMSVPCLARLWCPGAIVVTTRRGEDNNPRHQKHRKIANRWVDFVVCVSASTATFAEATELIDTRKLRVIPNGVNLPELRGLSAPKAQPLRFGTLGTIKPVKGTDLLVDAFLRLATDVPAELCIAGGDDRSPTWAAALVRNAGESHLGQKIRFLGHLEDSLSFLRTLDVFVLPSRSEGMSNALLEAMALGLPCIATDVGSNRELLLGHAKAGVVCEPTADGLHHSMRELACAATARTELGKAARRVVEKHYSVGRMVRAYEELYAS
jgi:glycosyltransferase involved in cell wall biosynthesis